jgi:hypothetical protein
MAMVCPRCATVHEQRLKCPGCGDTLEYPETPRPASLEPPAVKWQDMIWGRIFVGLLLSQGFFYALRHLATGVMLITELSAEQTDDSGVLFGLVLSQVLQGLALVVGAGLIGSGQRHGAILGAVVGVWNGVLAGLAPQAAGQPFSTVALYGDPLLQTTLGALAGWVGSVVWAPLPVAQPRTLRRAMRKAAQRQRPPLFEGRIAFVRVTIGTLLAVSGALSATALLALIARLGDSGIATDATILDQLVTWEIKALALLAGGAVAGSNTHNGMKQGLCVGIGAAVLLAGLEPRARDQWFEMVGVLFAGCTSLGLIGGWFGSQLFPPVVSFKRRTLEASGMV